MNDGAEARAQVDGGSDRHSNDGWNNFKTGCFCRRWLASEIGAPAESDRENRRAAARDLLRSGSSRFKELEAEAVLPWSSDLRRPL
ncbi:hypothetical protein TIFTF001_019828 [Ficus carica]|uniref:Uncharacterized protein n=1 Tax=Ficus carica TaxID=3494 RepID=A0AA88ACF4_FICCA|nr:hypothetical protein TIFTF001_019828 [Ficus carica]